MLRFITMAAIALSACLNLNAASCKVDYPSLAHEQLCTNLNDGDSIIITSYLLLNQNYKFYKNTDIHIIVDGGAIIYLRNAEFAIGSGGSLQLINNGKLSNGWKPCNANLRFKVGSETVASCNGLGADYSFDEINEAGGMDSTGALPVEMLYFQMVFSNNTIRATWATASEVNSSHFELLLIDDNLCEDYVGRVEARGNSSTVNYYELEIPRHLVSQKTTTFKLVQYDFDGAFEEFYAYYSPISTSSIFVGLYESQITIRNICSRGECVIPMSVEVCDLRGQTVYQAEVTSDVFFIDTQQFRKGYYLIAVNDEIFRVVL